MIPKVIFKYSFVYEKNLFAPHIKNQHFDQQEYSKYVGDYTKELEQEWGNLNNKILSYMTEITGLKWRVDFIPCYLVRFSQVSAFSAPLTIQINIWKEDKVIHFDISRFIDCLVHELIHNLFVQNNVELNNEYPKESFLTRVHVFVHAIHKEIYLKFFDEERLKRDVTLSSRVEDYKRAWEIVNKEGSKKIIKMIG